MIDRNLPYRFLRGQPLLKVAKSCKIYETEISAYIPRVQTRSQSLLICSSKATKDWGEMMSRSRGRLGRAKDFRAAFP